MARIGIKGEAKETPKATKIGIRKMKDMDQEVEPSGEAIEQNRKTQFGYGNDSDQTTGNKNYKSPGCAGGMT